MTTIKLLSNKTGETCTCCAVDVTLNDVAYGLATERAEAIENEGGEMYQEKFQDMVGKAIHEVLDCPIDLNDWNEVGYFFNSRKEDMLNALTYLTTQNDEAEEPGDKEGIICWLNVKSNDEQRDWLINYYEDCLENEIFED